MKIRWENIKYLLQPLPEPVVIKEVISIPRQDLKDRIVELERTVTELISREETLLKELSGEEHPQKIYWDGKHEEKVINYNARNLPYTDKRLTMDVRTFIMADDITVRRWVQQRKFLKCNDPLKYDHLIRDFYLEDRKDFVYAFDETTAKVSECWLFPFELSMAGRGDCEDHAHRMKSRLNAAGLPDWRSRVVCGMTRGGYGHSTVYYLADDLKTWVHLNSTTPASQVRSTLPTINDEQDLDGIGDVWFSFNKEKSWANFAVPNSDENKRFKYVEVL